MRRFGSCSECSPCSIQNRSRIPGLSSHLLGFGPAARFQPPAVCGGGGCPGDHLGSHNDGGKQGVCGMQMLVLKCVCVYVVGVVVVWGLRRSSGGHTLLSGAPANRGLSGGKCPSGTLTLPLHSVAPTPTHQLLKQEHI